MTDSIALITMMLWPAVPLFWVPVHGLPGLFKRLGLLTYILPLITWMPVAYLIYSHRAFLLRYRIIFPLFVTLAGIAVFAAGALLQLWTARLLHLSGLIGVPEVSRENKGRFVAEGAFGVVRHPTYLSHSMMFLGVFLMTGIIAVGISTLIDLVAVNLLVIPLEEKELLARFGEEYRRYKEDVPRLFPRIRHGG